MALLKGSAFFTNESNVIKNLMKANLHVDFVVNGTESKGTLSLKVGGTSVALNATLNITATKPANVKEIKVSENFMEKTIQYHADAQFEQVA